MSTEGEYLSSALTLRREAVIALFSFSSLFNKKCIPPGDIYTTPPSILSPLEASFTGSMPSLFSLSAKYPVNTGGICCEMTIAAGRSLGSPLIISRIADGPPVEAPTATIFTILFSV